MLVCIGLYGNQQVADVLAPYRGRPRRHIEHRWFRSGTAMQLFRNPPL